MFNDKNYIKFIQNSKELKSDILCINILEKNDLLFKKSIKTIFVNSNYDSIGFDSNIELKNFVFIHLDLIFRNKKGKYISHRKISNDKPTYCWVEPFYFDENYGYLEQALNYALNETKTTLIRSTKFSGAHSFVSNFDENKNSFKDSNNLFYEEINYPAKLLFSGNYLDEQKYKVCS